MLNNISKIKTISFAVFIVLIISIYAVAYAAEINVPISGIGCGKSETVLGDIVADSLKYSLKTNIAFVLATELKPNDENIPAGKISSRDIAALLSYPNDKTAVVELSGRSIRSALEKSVSIFPQPNLAFLNVSGLRFSFDPTKPKGERVVSITIENKFLDEGTVYTVAMINSLADGAVGYGKIWDQDSINKKITDTTLTTALDNYLSSKVAFDYSNLNRISIVK